MKKKRESFVNHLIKDENEMMNKRNSWKFKTIIYILCAFIVNFFVLSFTKKMRF